MFFGFLIQKTSKKSLEAVVVESRTSVEFTEESVKIGLSLFWALERLKCLLQNKLYAKQNFENIDRRRHDCLKSRYRITDLSFQAAPRAYCIAKLSVHLQFSQYSTYHDQLLCMDFFRNFILLFLKLFLLRSHLTIDNKTNSRN